MRPPLERLVPPLALLVGAPLTPGLLGAGWVLLGQAVGLRINEREGVVLGLLMSAVLALGAWFLMRHRFVHWTWVRVLGGVGLAVVIAFAAIVGIELRALYDDDFFALWLMHWLGLWMLLTHLLWRETAAERALRVSRTGAGATLPCPKCRYDMRGLREARCPECGTVYTLDGLLEALR